MTHSASHQVTRTWILLVILTVFSMAAGRSGVTGVVADGIVLAAAVIKGRWMLLDFLKLRHVPSGWRAVLFSWLLLVAGAAWATAALPLLRI